MTIQLANSTTRDGDRTKGSNIRMGDTDLPTTDYELYSFEAFRKHLHDDERPIERAASPR